MFKEFIALDAEKQITWVKNYFNKLTPIQGSVNSINDSDKLNDLVYDDISKNHRHELTTMTLKDLKQLKDEFENISFTDTNDWGEDSFQVTVFSGISSLIVGEEIKSRINKNTAYAASRYGKTSSEAKTENLENILLEEEKMILNTINQLETYRYVSNQLFDANRTKKNVIIDRLIHRLRSNSTPLEKLTFVLEELQKNQKILGSKPQTDWFLKRIINEILTFMHGFKPNETTNKISKEIENQIGDDTSKMFGKS